MSNSMTMTRVLTVLATMLYLAEAHAQTVPAWVDALSVGQWYSIPNTAMSSVAPASTPSGGTGPASKVDAWTSFVIDPRDSKVYSAANGGHNDYAGNEVDVLELESSPPRWVERLAPTPNAQISTSCQSYNADGRPASRHSYYGAVLYPADNRITLIGGARWCFGGGFQTAVSSYNVATNSWNAAATHPDSPAEASGSTHATTLDPLTGDIYAFAGWSLYKWSRSTNTWSTPIHDDAIWGLEAMSAFDTSRGRILVLGGENGEHQTYTVATGTLASITLTGASAANISSAGKAAMVYVPAIDSFLVRLSSAGGTVYRVSAADFQVTTFATTGGTSVPSAASGPYNKFLYAPRLGGVIYVPSYGGNAWFLKVHGLNMTAPTAPSGLRVE